MSEEEESAVTFRLEFHSLPAQIQRMGDFSDVRSQKIHTRTNGETER
jgi:hypothetical protein